LLTSLCHFMQCDRHTIIL